nr:hypothetical protein [Archangium primigenium]
MSCLLALHLLGAAPAPKAVPAPKAAPPPAAPAAPAPAPFRWNVPGVVSQVDVPGQMDVGGIPIRLEVYTSKETIPFLLQSFATAFDEAGYYIQARPPRVMRQPHLTALDTRTLTAYTVILEPAGAGLTTVVLGEARMGDFKPPQGAPTVPLYPGATNLLQGDFEGAKTYAYRAPASEDTVRAWYRDALTQAGYQEESPGIFHRDTRQVRLSLRPDKGATSVMLFLETSAVGTSLDSP